MRVTKQKNGKIRITMEMSEADVLTTLLHYIGGSPNGPRGRGKLAYMKDSMEDLGASVDDSINVRAVGATTLYLD
jgi:hypothetical protein